MAVLDENIDKTHASELFQKHQLAIHKQADHVFAILMPLQWLAGILAAFFVSPLTWYGVESRVHIHVWAAIFLGGTITLLPMLLVIKHPGTRITRNVVAISQMLMTGLLIHLSGGRIETHFHVFGSLAFLAFYRDWRVLVPATLVTALDHLLRGWFYPMSMYGVLTGGEWRWIEHACWVIFIDIFLIASCHRSAKEMWDIAQSTADLDASEQRYRAIMEQTSEGIALIEPETLRIMECNEAFCRLVGCQTIAETIKLTIEDFSTIDAEEIKLLATNSPTQNDAVTHEKTFYCLNSLIIPVDININVISYNNRQAYCAKVKDVSARKRTEAELQRLALVAQKTQNAVIIYDTQGVIQWVNEGFTRLSGYEPEDVVGSEPGEMFCGPATDPQMLQKLRQSVVARKSFEGEIYQYGKGGRSYWLSLSVMPLNNQRDELQGFFAIATDITERKQAESELRRLALVVQKTQHAIVICDPRGYIQWANEGFTRTTGYALNEVLNKRPGHFLHGEKTDPKTVAAIRAALVAHQPFEGEIYHYRKDGNGRWFSLSISPIEDEHGVLQGFISIKMDISDRKAMEEELRRTHDELEMRVIERTLEYGCANEALQLEVNERKRAERELSEAQGFLSKVLNSLPNPIFVKDENGKFSMVNTAFTELYGKSAEELIGKGDNDFHSPEQAQKFLEDDRQVMESQEEKFILEEQHTDYQGNVHWLQVVKRPMMLGENMPRYLLGISTDLTERKNLENQLRHAQKMESIGQLAAGIAHEINTPTQYVGDNTRFVRESFGELETVLAKFSELLASARVGLTPPELIAQVEQELEAADVDYLLAEIPTALQQSLEGVTRIAKIVQAMKDFAHPGSNEKKAADLNKAIESTLTVARNEWKYVAEVETTFAPDLPLVPCLLGEFNQVILNLTINAAHAIADVIGDSTHGKGKITITTAKIAQEWAEIRISDTGTGIPVAAQSRIFDPFFTTKEVGKGTGQGLAISHNVIVEKHKGQLFFETEMGQGTTFIIRLPLVEPTAE
jgi:two-component system, NtrC family, sensor kinase